MNNKNLSNDVKAVFSAIQDTLTLINAANKMFDENAVTFTVTEEDGKLIISAETRLRRDEEALKRMREAQRREWIDKWYKAFMADCESDSFANDHDDGYICVYRSTIHNGRQKIVIGEAQCSPADEFNYVTGCAIAYARACGEKIPDFI